MTKAKVVWNLGSLTVRVVAPIGRMSGRDDRKTQEVDWLMDGHWGKCYQDTTFLVKYRVQG